MLSPVQDALTEQLDAKWPQRPVFLETVQVAAARQDKQPGAFFFVDIKSPGFSSLAGGRTDCAVLVDVGGYLPGESHKAYRRLAGELDGIFRPVFRFADRAITVQTGVPVVVDGMLHYTFTFHYIPAVEVDENTQLMGELDLALSQNPKEGI